MSAVQNSPLAVFGRRLGAHVGVYAASHVGIFFFGMVNVAVLTRVLPIAEFGQLAIYLLLVAMLTMIYNLGSLQGVLIAVFGAGGADDDMGFEEAEGERYSGNRERALTTGVLLTVAIGALGTIAVFSATPLFASILGQPGATAPIRLAALCAASGAVWRLVQNVPRLERRPVLYSALSLIRPALALTIGIVLVLNGGGVEGVLVGLAVGTTAATLIAIAISRRSYALGLDLSIIPVVFRSGAMIVPIMLTVWIITNVDLYLVSTYSSPEAIGPYRVAMRLGAGISYLVSAVSSAFLPLKRTPLYTAMKEEHGPSHFGSMMLSAFVFVSIWALLGLTLLADVLIRIAPSSYAGAAPLVPLVGLGMVASGVLMVLYRGAKFSHRRAWHIGLMIAAAVIFLAAGFVLVPAFGGYGAAASQIVAFGLAAATLMWVVQRSKHPMQIDHWRLLRALSVGVLCIALGQLAGPFLGQWKIVADIAILAAFPALLLLARAFPSEELRVFVDIPQSARPRRRKVALRDKLKRLDPADRHALSELLKGSSVGEAAQALALPEPVVLSRFVSSLRQVGPGRRLEVAKTEAPQADEERGGEEQEEGEEEPIFADADERETALASYLLDRRGVATRDEIAERLHEGGVDPLDLDGLDSTIGSLRRIPRRKWRRLTG